MKRKVKNPALNAELLALRTKCFNKHYDCMQLPARPTPPQAVRVRIASN